MLIWVEGEGDVFVLCKFWFVDAQLSLPLCMDVAAECNVKDLRTIN